MGINKATFNLTFFGQDCLDGEILKSALLVGREVIGVGNVLQIKEGLLDLLVQPEGMRDLIKQRGRGKPS